MDLKHKLQEAQYEVELLYVVMNLDFNKPKEKQRKDALEKGVDLTDPRIVSQFKLVQKQRLQELRKRTEPGYDPMEEKKQVLRDRCELEKQRAMDE